MTKIVDILVPEQQDGTTSVVQSWLVAVGESVTIDDPIVELETDKVVLEVPSPATGVIAEIVLNTDDDAVPGVLLGRIDVALSNTSAPEKPLTPGSTLTEKNVPDARPVATLRDDVTETRLSPSVRRVLAEAGATGANITGTGRNGRITKADALTHVAKLNTDTHSTPKEHATNAHPTVRSSKIPHSAMRRSIAKHMSQSVTVAPHVTAVFEADFSAIMAHRAANKAAFADAGVSLTYTSYFILAAVRAMHTVPIVNSQWHDDAVEVFNDINIGIGTALGNKGLIVPVVSEAQSLSLKGIATRLQGLTQKARDNKLQPQDLRNGTFTISNHGVSGSLVASPIIINQPQCAILGIGKLEKRVCVTTLNGVDAIQIKPKAFVSLTIDHRVIDGHQTNAWLTRFVETIEGWPDDE